MGGRGSRRAAAILVCTLAACASDWNPAFHETAPPHLFDTVAIADVNDALTFARAEQSGVRRLIAVTEYRDGVVRGHDVALLIDEDAIDPISVFHRLGYEALRDRIRTAKNDTRVSLPANDLIIPVDLRDHHIAAATNFPEHAGDAGVEDGPFLFPKLVQPTGPYDPVPAGTGLLDYEVEVAWVTLAPLAPGDAAAHMGLVLANDFTDRETLLRHVNAWDPASGDGFATGKSFPGFLPIGNLFVIPKDHRRFVAALDLRLYVDGRLRQESSATGMVWDFDAIIAHTWAWKDRKWDHRGTQVSLLGDSDVIPERTLLLSGTPHGTIFAGIHTHHMISGLAGWTFGGWDQSIPSQVVSAYIADARAAGAYLKPGQAVEIHVDGLGVLRNSVVR